MSKRTRWEQHAFWVGFGRGLLVMGAVLLVAGLVFEGVVA